MATKKMVLWTAVKYLVEDEEFEIKEFYSRAALLDYLQENLTERIANDELDDSELEEGENDIDAVLYALGDIIVFSGSVKRTINFSLNVHKGIRLV